MRRNRWWTLAGVVIGAAFLWAVVGSFRSEFAPWSLFERQPRAAPPKPDNPCNPNAARAGNPCNPNAARAGNPCNPGARHAGNPCSPTAKRAGNPCNPNTARAGNPCNPGAAKAGNPCNPNAARAGNPCNPGAAKAGNPCNPNAGHASNAAAPVRVGFQTNGVKIGWGRNFRSWDVVTGYVTSHSHGNRLVQTYVYPSAAARVYKHNAELARQRKTEGYQVYPPGTQIVQESWVRNDLGGPGKPGPVFFMRKQDPGYDAAGSDWQYGFTRNDLDVIGEGHDGPMQFCKACHARADKRDFVYATER